MRSKARGVALLREDAMKVTVFLSTMVLAITVGLPEAGWQDVRAGQPASANV